MLLTKTDEQILLHLALGRITFLSFNEKIILSKNLDNFHSLVLLSIEDISKLIHRTFKRNVVWNGEENLRMAEIALLRCKKMQIDIIPYFDQDYPELLKYISDPPYILFSRGNKKALTQNCVSVVGTRRLSPNGKAAAINFAYEAVVNKTNVVSGLANGADGYAHQGAVDAYFDYLENQMDVSELGKTIAVIPSAIDEIVPYGHRRLAEKILQTGGCIISEYEPGMSMVNWHFVGRNRIIAGMSPATVVVEAPAGSGALITADFALENGRDVMFHEAAFGQGALQISEVSLKRLEWEVANGFAGKYKIENTPQKYLEAGAPVIKNYKDYCIALMEVPGKRSMAPVQGELF